jgi:hypothetical protein
VLLARLPCVDSAPQKRSGLSADLSVYRITGPVYTVYRYCTGTGKKTPGGAGTHTGTGTVPVLGETSRGRARCALVGRDGCEVRLCEPCALVSCVPCVQCFPRVRVCAAVGPSRPVRFFEPHCLYSIATDARGYYTIA